MNRVTAIRFTALALGAFCLAACSILPKTEAVDVYQLPASPASPAQDAKPVAWSLRISRPASDLPLSGQHIVVVPDANVISTYKGARWSDAIPVLVRNRLIDAFRADGRIASVSSDENNLQASYDLKSDLRAFQSEYRNGLPEVVIRLDALLVLATSDQIVATRRFEIRQPVSGTALPAVVQAFGLACDQLALQLVNWTVEQQVAASAVSR